MISGVQAYSPIYAPHAASPARRTQEAREPFSVPASALRAETAQPAEPPRPTRDPVADAVAFSRDYPQILLNQPYAPPPVQQVQSVAPAPAGDQAAAEGGRSTPGLGQEMDNTALGNGIPGDPGGEETLNAEETGEDEGSEETEEAGGGEEKANGEELSREEQVQVTELKNRDREVRAHEQAHQAVGGAYAGGASYEYQQGPDGQRYAVGGEVSIDISPERDPQATIAKMQQVKAAAMAPAEPSGQDRAVAASATATEMQARSELSAASAAGRSGGQEGEAAGEEDAANEGEVDGAGASSNPFVEEFQRRNRTNPYADSASTPDVLNLPGAYRAVDVVA